MVPFNFINGKVVYDGFNLDLCKPIENQYDLLTEDLLQVTFCNGKLLDLGWYPEFNPEGRFILMLIENENWDNPLIKIEFNRMDLICENLKKSNELCLIFLYILFFPSIAIDMDKPHLLQFSV